MKGTSGENQLDQMLKGHNNKIQAIAKELRAFIIETAPDLKEELKSGWNNLVYKGKGVVLAISPYKEYVSVHFYQGAALHDPNSMLEGGGKKLRHVKIHNLDKIDRSVLEYFITQAVELDNQD